MKVAYDHYAFHSQDYGGVTRYLYELISRTALDANFETSLFQGFHINCYPFDSSKFKHYFGLHRPNIHQLRHFFKPINQFMFQRFISKHSPDLIHFTHYIDTAPEFKGARIITVHDMTHEIFSDLFPADDKTSIQKKVAVERADHILAVSHSTKNDLVRLWGVPESKITVTHHASSLSYPKSETSLVNTPYVLFTGSRSGYKNFQFSLRAFAQVRDKGITFVAFGGGKLSSAERQLIKELGLEKRVTHFSGNDEVLSSLYSHAICLVYPSLYEGFGFPILEAFQYDCPVIANSNSSIPEVAGVAAKFFEKEQIESLVFILNQVIENQQIRRDMQELGRIQLKKFSWNSSFEKTRAIYLSYS